LNWINFGYVISFADVKERSFQVEAVSSALITMIIYGVQLFFTLKRYKKDIRQAYDMNKKKKLDDKLKEPDLVYKGIKYPGFLFRHIGGGVTICFHIIFSIIIVSREIGTRIHSRKWSFGRLEWVLIFIISPLVLYTLQKIMTREGRKIFI
jgi:Ca2+/H+ antiporter